jgi:hypothetical protein
MGDREEGGTEKHRVVQGPLHRGQNRDVSAAGVLQRLPGSGVQYRGYIHQAHVPILLVACRAIASHLRQHSN